MDPGAERDAGGEIEQAVAVEVARCEEAPVALEERDRRGGAHERVAVADELEHEARRTDRAATQRVHAGPDVRDIDAAVACELGDAAERADGIELDGARRTSPT